MYSHALPLYRHKYCLAYPDFMQAPILLCRQVPSPVNENIDPVLEVALHISKQQSEEQRLETDGKPQ